MVDIVQRLRNPPFGTETSERNAMSAAADEIERLRNGIAAIADDFHPDRDADAPLALAEMRDALNALRDSGWLPEGGDGTAPCEASQNGSRSEIAQAFPSLTGGINEQRN